MKEILPNFRAQCLFVHILHLKRLPVISSSLGFLSLLEPRSAFPVGMGGKVPPAALSDRTPSVNRAARQYLAISFSPASMGGHCSALRGKPAILNKSPLSLHLRFGGSELTYSSI